MDPQRSRPNPRPRRGEFHGPAGHDHLPRRRGRVGRARGRRTMSERKLTIDFDHHSRTYKEHWAELAEERVAHCPVAWTEAHGGYWILSDHELLTEAIRDPE